jgi:hypothetical protein
MNDAVFAYLIYHHIATTDMAFGTLIDLGDCAAMRTVVRALEVYTPPEELGEKGESACSMMKNLLVGIVPCYIWEMSRSCEDAPDTDDFESIVICNSNFY